MKVPPVDKYTIGHWMLGFIFGLWGAPREFALRVSLAFEAVEDKLKELVPEIFPVALPDTPENRVNDTRAWMHGWAFARRHFAGDEAKIWRAWEVIRQAKGQSKGT